MICSKCKGEYEFDCKLCEMFRSGRAPAAAVQEGPIGPDRPKLKNSEIMAPPKKHGDDWMASEALAVHPSQVSQANARNKKHGIGARYDKTGMAHIPSRTDRKKLVKLEGMVDKSGGYGD